MVIADAVTVSDGGMQSDADTISVFVADTVSVSVFVRVVHTDETAVVGDDSTVDVIDADRLSFFVVAVDVTRISEGDDATEGDWEEVHAAGAGSIKTMSGEPLLGFIIVSHSITAVWVKVPVILTFDTMFGSMCS